MSDESKKLTDGRQDLAADFERPRDPADRALGDDFVDSERARRGHNGNGNGHMDPASVDRERLGESFADPNSRDDARLGRLFEESNAQHGKKYRHKDGAPRARGGHKTLWLLLVAALVVFLLVFFLGFLPRHGREKKNEELADQRRTAKPAVQVERVRRPKAGAGLVVPGTTTPFVEASIYARANGYLQRRLVDIGDHVHRGQLLAVIESPDLDQQVDQAREQVRQAQAQKAQQDTQLALTKITVDRFRVLVAKGVVSRQEGDQREADFRAQEANVNAAERNVEAFQANLRRVVALQSYERVTAPFDGVVTARNVDVGALISAAGSAGGSSAPSQSPQSGPTGSSAANSSGASGNAPTAASPSGAGGGGGPLFSIAQVDRLRILIAVPEGYASAIRTGAPAKLRFQELPSAEFSGKVTRTSLSIDQNTRTLLTEVQVDNRGGRLMTGMYTVVTFASLPGAAALTVPGDTIAIRNGRNVVGLVKDGRIHLQPVDVGRDFGPAVEIIGGLHEGDMIAASFTDDVRDNEEVEVQESKNPGEASGANALPPKQTQPPGGSSQYGDQSVTDQNLQGQQAGQNKGQAAQKNSQGGSQH